MTFNNFDMEGMLRCIDSKWADQINTFLSYTVGKNGVAVGTYVQILKTMMPFLPIVSGGNLKADDFPQVELTVLRTNIDGNSAEVMLSGIFSCGEMSEPFSATVKMKLEDEIWVICGIG